MDTSALTGKALTKAEKSNEEQHAKWWAGYEAMREGVRAEAKAWLDARYPGWNDIEAYWN